MPGFLIDHPAPDFAELTRVIKGEQEPTRVHPLELHIDDEIFQVISERELGKPWLFRGKGPRWIPQPLERQTAYYKQLTAMYYHLGYDYVPVLRLWVNHPQPRQRQGEDTAALSRGERQWVDETRGLITSWEEFEQFPWDQITTDLSPFRIVAERLPAGMKMTAKAELFEHVTQVLFGYEQFFYLLHDTPDLVTRVFDRWGQKVYDYYNSVIGLEHVGAIFHGDDLGFKTTTFLSPNELRRLVLPWLKKYAALAHAHGKMFWFHCCGNIYKNGVIEDLIDDVHVDAIHSFQDLILPVDEFKARYGNRVAALGGVDVDKLASLDEASLRNYLQTIMERCVPHGRFALGSGNSVTNYIPPENYLILLNETRQWSPSSVSR